MNLIHYINNIIPKFVYSCNKNKHILIHCDLKYLVEFALFINMHMNIQAKSLMDLTGIDYPANNKRFQLVYNILSIVYSQRFIIKINANETQSVPSLIHCFASISWYERECWDMYGVHFANNPDLRRILTDYGFQGHPLRKDFPLTGFKEIAYSERRKNLITKPVSLVQDYRLFQTITPWEFFWHAEKPNKLN